MILCLLFDLGSLLAHLFFLLLLEEVVEEMQGFGVVYFRGSISLYPVAVIPLLFLENLHLLYFFGGNLIIIDFLSRKFQSLLQTEHLVAYIIADLDRHLILGFEFLPTSIFED